MFRELLPGVKSQLTLSMWPQQVLSFSYLQSGDYNSCPPSRCCEELKVQLPEICYAIVMLFCWWGLYLQLLPRAEGCWLVNSKGIWGLVQCSNRPHTPSHLLCCLKAKYLIQSQGPLFTQESLRPDLRPLFPWLDCGSPQEPFLPLRNTPVLGLPAVPLILP